MEGQRDEDPVKDELCKCQSGIRVPIGDMGRCLEKEEVVKGGVDQKDDQTEQNDGQCGDAQMDKEITNQSSQDDYPHENPPQKDPPFLF